ncbi:MAG: flagellar basal body rod protein FlgC [Firmicutes bacterium]|nr:flagellar basal body rod protein FlgC [Bacillota bacterium]
MRLFSTIEHSASALTAERFRMDVIANNIANANTTRTPEGGPFQRHLAVFATKYDKGQPAGVQVLGVVKDQTPPRLVYNPGHPDADANGYVSMPNVNVISEMVDLISAARAYEANVTVINEAKKMVQTALQIGK